ncbi:MAG: deaminase [Patescibacteria group bacterium]
MQPDYPYLPEGRTIKYVPASDLFMIEAMKMRNQFSTELNHPTGAVVVMDGKIIGKAANQAALKGKKTQELHKKGLCFRRILGVPSGQRYWLCPGCAQFRHHCEVRAIRDALLNEKSIIGADLYLYGHWWCCKPCWDAMIKAGIKNVYLVENATELFRR